MKYSDFIKFVKETIRENRRPQDRRLRSFTNSITRSIMAIYDGRKPDLKYDYLDPEDMIVEPNSENPELYVIDAGFFPISFDPDSIDPEYFEDGIDPSLSVVLEIDKNSSNFNVSASDKDLTGEYDIGIHIAIETPKDFAKSEMMTLRNEIANSVRHELEHITQGEVSDQYARAYSRGEKYYNFLHDQSSVKNKQAKYLLKPEEIPAHVRGYAQNSKTIKDLEDSIEDLLDSYIDQSLIDTEEKSIIKNTWIDWAQNNINRKGYKKS